MDDRQMSWWRGLVLRIRIWNPRWFPNPFYSPSIAMVHYASLGVSEGGLCEPASAAQLDVIRAGVQGVEASNDVREAWAVRSKDFACVYMVAARVYGAELPVEGSEPGVWAISGQPDAPGLTLAVNAIARRFTSYPDARKARPAITMAADGAEFAAHCALLGL